MLVWLLALVTVLLVTPALFALILLARRLHRKKRQGFGRRPAPDPTTVADPAPLTRKKPDWVVQEVLRLKALMGKQVGCRKVADTFNRLHTPTRVGKSFVSNTIRNHQYAQQKQRMSENRERLVFQIVVVDWRPRTQRSI